jgi:hypothetical protein
MYEGVVARSKKSNPRAQSSRPTRLPIRLQIGLRIASCSAPTVSLSERNVYRKELVPNLPRKDEAARNALADSPPRKPLEIHTEGRTSPELHYGPFDPEGAPKTRSKRSRVQNSLRLCGERISLLPGTPETAEFPVTPCKHTATARSTRYKKTDFPF